MHSSKKIIFTNGCFDILHRGHYELLAFCKTMGRVTVGLNSDESIRRLKGPSRPVNRESDRIFALECCRYVDEVIIFDEDTPIKIITELKPDVIVKGSDYKIKDVVGANLAQVVLFPFVAGISTSNLISKMGLEL
jgi:D-beta-D-heptose 7-phosphate kinase/D-beta-D-heptose 1-phosphate adenosyltransferase